MNLLVKKIGLVLLPALFFACEDPTELGANLNPNTGAVSTHYIEIPVNTSQVRSDSTLSSLQFSGILAGNSIGSNPYVGRLDNPDFGVTKATLYSNIGLPAALPAVGTNARLDSVRIQLVWNSRNVFGNALRQEQRFQVYQLAQPISPSGSTVVNDTVNVLFYRYYAINKEPLGEPLGQLRLDISTVFDKLDSASFVNDANRRILAGQLDFAFGEQLLAAFRSNTDGVRDSQAAFDNFVKGLALVPDDMNTFVTTYDLGNANSGVFLYYTQGTEQRTIRLPFYPSETNRLRYGYGNTINTLPAYYGIETDRSGTGLAGASSVGHLQEFDPLDDRVYFQGIGGLLPKVEFKGFKDFVLNQDEGDLISINRASLEFDSLFNGVTRQPIPSEAVLYFVNDNNRRFQSAMLSGAERAPSTTRRIYTVGETSVNYFSSDIVFNLEQYMRSGEDRYLQAILYPAESVFNSPNQFVIKPGQVKLKIWYTKLARPNL